MTGGFTIDPVGIRAAAPGFEQVSQRLTEIGQRLKASLDAQGECWGHDSYGETFLAKYTDPLSNAMDYFPSLSSSIADISTGLVEMADTADRGEAASQSGFTA